MSFYTDAVKELEVLFDAVNARWFKGELDPPIITIMASKKAYGWFYADSWEDSIPVEGKEASKLNELNISPEYLSRSVAEICVTLCHEACHLFAHQTGQQDTSNNHAYHNRVFKSIAEDHGLIVSKHSKASQGWAQTDPNAEMEEWLKTVAANEKAFEYFRNPPVAERKPTKKTTKYTCPECDKAVRGDEGIFIICKECKKLMLTKEQKDAIQSGETTEDKILSGEWGGESGE